MGKQLDNLLLLRLVLDSTTLSVCANCGKQRASMDMTELLSDIADELEAKRARIAALEVGIASIAGGSDGRHSGMIREDLLSLIGKGVVR